MVVEEDEVEEEAEDDLGDEDGGGVGILLAGSNVSWFSGSKLSLCFASLGLAAPVVGISRTRLGGKFVASASRLDSDNETTSGSSTARFVTATPPADINQNKNKNQRDEESGGVSRVKRLTRR